jgi:RHS repeat-associated protein
MRSTVLSRRDPSTPPRTARARSTTLRPTTTRNAQASSAGPTTSSAPWPPGPRWRRSRASTSTGWSLGTIVNGQQLIEAGAETGISTNCADIPEAAARTSGPAPHALYFAYQQTDTPGEYEALEACYDASGNMVALFRWHLVDCGADPLDEHAAEWTCSPPAPAPAPDWVLFLDWDDVGRLSRVEKVTHDSAGDAVIRNVYDASDTRVIRLDEVSTEGSGQATLYISAGYEVRDATVQTDGTYLGGEETKYVFAGDQRVARVVEQTTSGPWPNPPGEPYVFHTLTNHLGSASVTFNAVPDEGDDIVVAQTQLPYGSEDARVESPTYGGWRVDYDFTDKEEDPDVGLMYFGARFYAPALGRWVSADAHWFHVFDGDPNVYRYSLNSPILLVDRDGLDPHPPSLLYIALRTSGEVIAQWSLETLSFGMASEIQRFQKVAVRYSKSKSISQKTVSVSRAIPIIDRVLQYQEDAQEDIRLAREGKAADRSSLHADRAFRVAVLTEIHGRNIEADEWSRILTEMGAERATKAALVLVSLGIARATYGGKAPGGSGANIRGTGSAATAAGEGIAAEGAALRPYGGPGGGHHVPAKSAFAGAPGYAPNAALAIPNAELARLGVSHSAVTGAQMTGYRALITTPAMAGR